MHWLKPQKQKDDIILIACRSQNYLNNGATQGTKYHPQHFFTACLSSATLKILLIKKARSCVGFIPSPAAHGHVSSVTGVF